LPFHPILPIGPIAPVPTSVSYSFWVPEFTIHSTRALVNDTDYATLGVVITDADGKQVAQYGPSTVSLGNLDEGTYPLNMHVAGIAVPPGGTMGVSFTILNHGSSKAEQDIESALTEFGSDIMKGLSAGAMGVAAALAVELSSWEASLVAALGDAVLTVIEKLLADCDGIVVGASLSLSYSDLTSNSGAAPWSWSTDYQGTTSSSGCGANSDYSVSYAVKASPPCVTVPDLTGLAPAKVAGVLQPVGLTGRETGTHPGNVDLPEVTSQSPAAGMIVMPTTVDYEVTVPEGGSHQLP
jgi:hypothetical protein